MQCKFCGENIDNDAEFCPHCGQLVDKSEQAEQKGHAQRVSQKQGMSNGAKGVIIALIAVVVIAIIVIVAAASSSGGSSSSSEVTTYSNGDSVYNPDIEDIKFDEESCTVYYDNLLMVYLNESISSQKANELANAVSGKIMGSISGAVNMVQVVVDPADLQTLQNYAAELMNDETVMYATFDVPVTVEVSDFTDTNPWDEDTSVTVTPDETNPEGNNWWAEAIGAYTAWSYMDEHEDEISPETIGVLDSGFDVDHPDLQGKITMRNNNSVTNHGTHVTGIMVANNNNIGIRGIADKSDILCVDRTEPEEQEDGTVADVSLLSTGEWVEMTKQLIEDGVKVINNSWGVGIPTEELYTQESLEKEGKSYWGRRDLKIMEEVGAYDTYIGSIHTDAFLSAENCMVLITQLEQNGYSDFLFVQAAGNGYNGADMGYDAELACYYCSVTEENYAMAAEEVTAGRSYEDFKNHIIIVGAAENRTNANGNYYMTDFSNFGDSVDICAPGQDIYSTIYETTEDGAVIHSYGMDDGTSMAAPMVTASAALLWSIDPSLSSAEVKNMLCTNKTASAIGVGGGRGYKYPMLNIGEVIRENYISINIKGTVLDKDGNPLDGVTVVAKDKDGKQVGDKATTVSDGKYKVNGLSAVGKYTIKYSKSDYTSKEKSLDVKSKTKKGIEEGATIKLKDVKLSDEVDVVDSGTCGENLTWVLDSNGTLTISGTGKMTDYTYEGSEPWDSNSYSVKKVLINNGVTSIGDFAFSNCESITSITIPDGVTSIGYKAFYHCNSLPSITIPGSVTNIGEASFDYCNSLPSITVDSSNSYFSSADGVLFNKDRTELICCPGGKSGVYTIPNSVKSIDSYAFECCNNLTSITIGNNVTSIGYGAFINCNYITSIKIPNSVTSIGDFAFYTCENLKSVTIGNGVTSISKSAFAACGSLTSITIPNSVTSIGDSAFWECSRLKSITIPNSVTSIGNEALKYCDSLTDIYYGGSKSDWLKIEFSNNNTYLTGVTVHYNSAV